MKEKIIFLPFAGGSRHSYRGFLKAIPEGMEPVFVELPNRPNGSPFVPMDSLEQIIPYIYNQLKDHLNGNYAIYGHSMGGLLAYLIVRYLSERSCRLPRYLVISSCPAPSRIEEKCQFLHLADSPTFWKKIYDYGGITGEILADPQLREMIEPALRSDVKVMETYRYDAPLQPAMNIPVLLLYGDRESLRYEDLSPWSMETSGKVKIEQMEGGHFFILGQERSIMEKMQFISIQNPIIAINSTHLPGD